MRTIYDTRRDNLRALIGQWGGPTSLARKLGHSNGAYIAQLAGPRPTRQVSEKVAREIEATLSLPAGWMDQEHAPGGTALDDQALTECVRAVATVLRDAHLKPDPQVYAQLVSLAYDRWKLVGRIDEPYLLRLTSLLTKEDPS
jgi:hypothetical protein